MRINFKAYRKTLFLGGNLKYSIVLISTLGLLLAGCKKEPYIVKSNLEVKQSFDVKTDGSEVVSINPGLYPTDLNINSSRVKAKIKTLNKEVVFRLKLPKKIVLPTNGTLELTSEQSGQPFHTTVHVKTDVKRGELQRDLENCSVFEHVQECYVAGNPPTHVCRFAPRERWGRKPVEYYLRSYHRQIQAILNPTGETGSAEILGSRVDSERVYTREGHCY